MTRLDEPLLEYTTLLRQLIANHFNEEETKTLAYDLGVEYDDLPGSGKIYKVRELIDYMRRQNRLEDLLVAVRGKRPYVDWPTPPKSEPPHTIHKQRKPWQKPFSWGVIIGVLGMFVLLASVIWVFGLVRDVFLPPSEQELNVPTRSFPPAEEMVANEPVFNDSVNTRIAFVSTRNGVKQIFSVDPINPQDLIPLTDTSNENWAPAWSPDGTQIAFTSQRDGNQEIYVMNADGRNQQRLTFDNAKDVFPTWSPDGTQLAFYSDRSGQDDIYTMDANGSNVRRLTYDGSWNQNPAWSPNGYSIAFGSDRDNVAAIYTINVQSGNITLLTPPSLECYLPAWSPDGTQIAFYAGDDKTAEIYLMNANGSNLRAITHNDVPDYAPAWSPDGQWLTFHSQRTSGDNREIFIMRVDGNDVHQITESPADDRWPEWQP